MKTDISDSYLFHEKIRKYERLVIDYFQEMKIVGGGEQSANHILAYLILHNKLTQNQIRELSFLYYTKGKRRGISKGTISMVLNRYLKHGIVRKKRINGKKSVFLYSVETNLQLQLIHIQTLVFRGSMKDIYILQDFLSFIQRNHEIDGLKKEFIQQRIKNLIEYRNVIADSVKNIVPEEVRKNIVLEIKQTKFPKMNQSLITMNLSDIERIFVNIYCHSEMLWGYNRKVLSILGFFIIREKQTQKMLREDTNLSSGTISQEISHFITENLVKRVKIIGIREPYYAMDRVYKPLLTRRIKMLMYNLKWESTFRKVVSELEVHVLDYKDLRGYKEVLSKGKQFLSVVPLYKQILAKLQEGLLEQE